MKSRYSESFLFPASQDDFRRLEIQFPAGGLHGVAVGYYDTNPEQKKLWQDSLAAQTTILAQLKNDLSTALQSNDYALANYIFVLIDGAEKQIAMARENLREDPNINAAAAKVVADINAKAEAADAAARQASALQASADFFTQQGAQDAARMAQKQADDYARQAAAQAAALAQAQAAAGATIQQAAEASEAAFKRDEILKSVAVAATQGEAMQDTSNITMLALDVDSSGPILAAKYADGGYEIVARGNGIDAWLSSHGYTRLNASQSPAYVNLLATHTAAVDTSTQTVQHTDAASGTVSTGNAATGVVRVTTSTGQTATGSGTVTAGGVTTTANPVTGTVTTTNTATGVTTTTSGSTGSTVQTVTAAAGGAGNIALFGLLGLLLLRGALK